MGYPEPAPRAGGDTDIAVIGALVADPGRCRIPLALDDGRALPATRLAAEAGVSPATAGSHLSKLTQAGLLAVEARGRHRYYRLAGPAAAGPPNAEAPGAVRSHVFPPPAVYRV
ncbi:ArsR/SmtB family transcription factor [Streptosporangium sp. V21-05]|uniref:ArsR/SmtB family transcription factor n=1 Tax=Streptosporangium sp. V21-05 TaxID=3446115 RepID=UPI003F53014B